MARLGGAIESVRPRVSGSPLASTLRFQEQQVRLPQNLVDRRRRAAEGGHAGAQRNGSCALDDPGRRRRIESAGGGRSGVGFACAGEQKRKLVAIEPRNGFAPADARRQQACQLWQNRDLLLCAMGGSTYDHAT